MIHIVTRATYAGLRVGWLLLLLIGAGSTLPAAAQQVDTGEAAMEEINDAFANADVDAFAHRAADRLDITIFGTGALYSRAQARYVMNGFFREYTPRRLVLGDPSKTDNSWFVAGKYWYENGRKPVSVYIRLRHNEGRWELREVRIDRSLDAR